MEDGSLPPSQSPSSPSPSSQSPSPSPSPQSPSQSVDQKEKNSKTTTLPTDLQMKIFSYIPFKKIQGRYVSQELTEILKSTYFADLHVSRSPTYPLLWCPESGLSGNIYVIDLDKYEGGGKVEITTTFGLPKVVGGDPIIVNSCNGLICISSNPIIIYNPSLGQCASVTKPNDQRALDKVLGIGYCVQDDSYKVLRAFATELLEDGKDVECEVCTLGGTLWRNIKSVPNCLLKNHKVKFPTFLNSSLHWLDIDRCSKGSPIIRFDCEAEQFGEITLPSQLLGERSNSFTCIGQLQKSLYICDSDLNLGELDIWIMMNYGVPQSWSICFKFTWSGNPYSWDGDRYKNYKPIEILGNGDLLLYSGNNSLVTYDGHRFKNFNILPKKKSIFVAIGHIPSFVPPEQVKGTNEQHVLKDNERVGENGKEEKAALNATPRVGENGKEEAAALNATPSIELTEKPVEALWLKEGVSKESP